jgi:hypothetical protein
MLNGFQTGLLQLYDWVIRTDTDELICTAPSLSLPGILSGVDAPAVFALGLNVVELPGDPPLTPDTLFTARPHAVFTGHYSKAFAVREPVDLMRHGVQVRPRRVHRFPFAMPRGLYLAHLKYASRAALEEANRTRMQIAAGTTKGLPGAAWQNAEDEAQAYYARVEAMPFEPWETAEDRAYTKLATDPLRDPKDRLIRARSLRFKTRTRLPERFGNVP